MKNLIYLSFVLLTLFQPCMAQEQLDANEILKNLDKNFFSLDMEFNMEMKILKKNKVRRSYKMKVFKKEKKLRMDILQPSVERDRRVLNDGDNLWMYLPRSSKLIKIPYKQAFLGGDASNRDILRISLVDDYETLGAIEESEDEIILRLKAKDLKTAYNKVNFYLDKKTKIPTKQEMLSLSGKVIKTIEYEDIVAFGGSYLATKLTIIDQLKSNSKTIFKYSDFSIDSPKTDIFFTAASLSK